ncbi:serine hydrolase [Dactylosporangium sucinum]|uniref:serine hydrolase n=1 Tax=Dactylosporangium sucinum TaxID=1424081 RepID=UPI00167CB9E0|nr:serine hydrolase [Dactylosporangium sucinum]
MDEILWSISVRNADGSVRYERDPHRVLSTASVGKLFLLLEVARQIDDGRLDPRERLRRTEADRVADSGLWQHLAVDELCVEDLAVLVAAVSDNLATNVLLRKVGLAAVQPLQHSALHDRVRDERLPEHEPRLSSGSADDLSRFMLGLRHQVYPGSRRLLAWMRNNTDLSMVAAAFGLDPLAHTGLANKTGTDVGVRADVGVTDDVAYAVIANFPADRTHEVLDHMRAIGAAIRRELPFA